MYEATEHPSRIAPYQGVATAYSTLHWRLRAYRGPAKRLKCVHCAERGEVTRAMDWARLHETDGEDIMDYIPLCRKCHIAYDKSGHRVPHTEETKFLLSVKNGSYQHTPEAVERIRETSTGRRHTAESRALMSANAKGRVISPEQRAKISATLKGNTNASGGKGITGGRGGVGGKRSGQALENIRAGQQRRRAREQAEREAEEA